MSSPLSTTPWNDAPTCASRLALSIRSPSWLSPARATSSSVPMAGAIATDSVARRMGGASISTVS
jgi:hypothetical protein